ncbi:hypothetical protein Ae201684P_000670 [Aphanomyces euteiches]|uniref:PX domain-containing protein n=1 Tax=Aphanomyces euteiches TaxID=100861 RepID=A0A6G0XRD3_9STRA|nr:hypothetical protein Ae201684_002088 [Aphanomyces euteiches]KAH9087259.1 hypothetical protein Ae201684P_000670 [Aphanomyces euteiches]
MIRYVAPRSLGMDSGWSALIEKEQKHEMKNEMASSRRDAGALASWTKKEKDGLDNLKALFIHNVRPKNSTCGDYVEYLCVIENSRSGVTWEIHRRYSLFHYFRETMDELFETPHCHYCKEARKKMKELVFPAKKIFNTDEIILQRVVEFHAYIQGILKILSNSFYRHCKLVSVQAHIVMKRFLTSDMRRHDVLGSKEQTIYSVPLLLRELQLKDHAKRSPKLTLEPIVEQPAFSLTKAC